MGQTATWAIPYPDPGDPPCDGDAAIKAMAARIGEILAAWEADRARLLRPPAALASYETATGATQTLSLAGQSNPMLNTVQLDTAGMADLGKRADRLYLPRPGQYAIGGKVVGAASVNPLVDAQLTLRCSAAQYFGGGVANPPVPWFAKDGHRYGADAGGEPFRVAQQVYVPASEFAGGKEVTVEVSWEHAAASIAITYADLWAVWLSDE